MERLRVDEEKINEYFAGRDNDTGYITKLFSEKRYEYDLKCVLKKQWFRMLQEDVGEEKDLTHILYKVHYEINIKKRLSEKRAGIRRLQEFFLKAAAVLFIPLLLYTGIQFFSTLRFAGSVPVEIKAPAWTRVEFSLPDGTKGWLNSQSSIKYYAGPKFKREVVLNGEAYFDVAKCKGKRFRVMAGNTLLTVMGTRFDVAAYDNEKIVEVVLEEGSLALGNRENNNILLMKPGELGVYDKEKAKITMRQVQTVKYTSWKDGRLVFRNDPIDVVARRLERWYNIKVELRGDFPDDIRLRATFIDEDLKEVLELLRRTLKVDYQIIESRVGVDDIYVKKKVLLMYKTVH